MLVSGDMIVISWLYRTNPATTVNFPVLLFMYAENDVTFTRCFPSL